MDSDATQPLDMGILSAAARAAVPRPVAAGNVLVHPTPLGGPTRRRVFEHGVLLAADSQQQEHDDGDDDTPLRPPLPSKQPSSRHGATEEEETEELLLLPRTSSMRTGPSAASKHTKSQAVRQHLAVVESVLQGAGSSVSSLTLAVMTGRAVGDADASHASTQDHDASVDGEGGVFVSPTLMGDSRSTTSKQQGNGQRSSGVVATAAEGRAIEQISDGVVIAWPSPVIADDMFKPAPCSIEPTLRVFEPTLVVAEDRLMQRIADADSVRNDAPYLDDVPDAPPAVAAAASLRLRGVDRDRADRVIRSESPRSRRPDDDSPVPGAESSTQGRSSTVMKNDVDTTAKALPPAVARLPTQLSQSSPQTGGRASLAAARPPPIQHTDPAVAIDDAGFKTPDKIIRRMSQDDAPLVPVSTARKAGRPSDGVAPAAPTITPSRRKVASPSAAAVATGDAVEVRWGGGWYPAIITAVASDGLTVVVTWPDGSTETKARNVVRARRNTLVATATSTTKRGRDSVVGVTPARPEQPTAELSRQQSAAKAQPQQVATVSIVSGTQLVQAMELESCSPPLPRVQPAAGRPTAVLTDSQRPGWTKSALGSGRADLADFVVVPVGATAAEYADLESTLQQRGAKVPRTVADLAALYDSDRSPIAVVILSNGLVPATDEVAGFLISALLACPAGALACAAIGMGWPAVPAGPFLALGDASHEVASIVVPNWPSWRPRTSVMATARRDQRPLSGFTIAVAARKSRSAAGVSVYAEVIAASGANVIDAMDSNAVGNAKPNGVFCDPLFQGSLPPEIAQTLFISPEFLIAVIIGARAWPASQAPHAVLGGVAPEHSMPVSGSVAALPQVDDNAAPSHVTQTPAMGALVAVPDALPAAENGSASSCAMPMLHPGEDYYADLSGDGSFSIVRIEQSPTIESVRVRKYRLLPELRLIGEIRKPFVSVELSPTVRSISARTILLDVPVFVLPPTYIDHIYVLRGSEAVPEAFRSAGASGSMQRSMAVGDGARQRSRPRPPTPAAASAMPAVVAAVQGSPPVTRSAKVLSTSPNGGRSPTGTDRPAVEFLEPLAAAWSYSSSTESQQRRYFRSAMVHGRLVEAGVLIRFEVDPPAPVIPKLVAAEPISAVGEVQQFYRDRDEDWFVVEVRAGADDDSSGCEPVKAADVLVIHASAVIEVVC